MTRTSLHWWESLFEAIDAKDTKTFLEFIAEDGVFRFANAPAAQGHQAIGGGVEGFFGTIKASKHHISRTWDDAHSRVCQGEVTYTRLDNKTVTVPFVNVFLMRGDKISEYQIYIDLAPLFA
jgi:ketosteroid isomerase-like protein